MRRRAWGWIAGGVFLFQGGFAVAQSSLNALEQELRDAKQQHQDVTSQMMSGFFSQVDAAMASPDAAVALYQQAGGTMPEPAPVVTEHENETATEKEARMAQDHANLSKLGAILQLQCGLMHYAALFVTKPDQKGLQNEWVAWLKSVARLYPQLQTDAPAENGAPKPEQPRKKRGERGERAEAPPAPASSFNLSDIRKQAVRDSIIAKFLGFNAWGDKEQGDWAVHDLPKLYRTNVLDPLRAAPTAATLAAWDAYIAMANADEKDDDHWNKEVNPPLQFDRAYDDYAITPNTEKLEVLVNLIKANPTHPKADDWIAQVQQLMADYRARHGGPATTAPTPAPSAPAGNPNVTVTTEQDGDATIIITHTNSPPVNPQH